MQMLPVTALSVLVQCPRQFFSQYVLKIKEPINVAMALGSVKHKVHELMSARSEQIICALKNESVQQFLIEEYEKCVRAAVMTQANMLRLVNVSLESAFAQSVEVGRSHAGDMASQLEPLLKEGLLGQKLWDALMPKVKSEYSVVSKKLKIKGRVDKLECYSNRLVPIELKSGVAPKEGVWPGHRVQAACYAMMLEEMFESSVPEAVVHYVDHKSRRLVVLNPFLREEIVGLAVAAHELVQSTTQPQICAKECMFCQKELLRCRKV